MDIAKLRISVVIPTYRRWDRLKLTLAALEGQTLPKEAFEVIVSDDGSADGTLERLNEYARTTAMHMVCVTGPNGGPSAARNRGIAKAQGEWVAMTDDDCVPEADWLAKHLACITKYPELSAIGGRVVRYSDSVISRYVDWTDVMLPAIARDGRVQYLVTANAVFKRELIERLGGFDETYKWPGGEDPDLSFRATASGAILGYDPGPVVRHMHRDSVRGTYRMFWHHGLGLGALQVLKGKLLAPSFHITVRRQLLPGIRRAFSERTLGESFVFAFLECVRHWAFRQGVLAYGTIAKSGSTSAN